LPIGRLSGARIAGHDDHPLSQFACPPLTTVAQDVERLATDSLSFLMQAITSGANACADHWIEAKVVMRASAQISSLGGYAVAQSKLSARPLEGTFLKAPRPHRLQAATNPVSTPNCRFERLAS
jgi:hypothetical protein